MRVLPSSVSAPIATGKTKAAPAGPSATKAHGQGAARPAARPNPHRQPNLDLTCEVVATISGAEKTPQVINQVAHGQPITTQESSPSKY